MVWAAPGLALGPDSCEAKAGPSLPFILLTVAGPCCSVISHFSGRTEGAQGGHLCPSSASWCHKHSKDWPTQLSDSAPRLGSLAPAHFVWGEPAAPSPLHGPWAFVHCPTWTSVCPSLTLSGIFCQSGKSRVHLASCVGHRERLSGLSENGFDS